MKKWQLKYIYFCFDARESLYIHSNHAADQDDLTPVMKSAARFVRPITIIFVKYRFLTTLQFVSSDNSSFFIKLK